MGRQSAGLRPRKPLNHAPEALNIPTAVGGLQNRDAWRPNMWHYLIDSFSSFQPSLTRDVLTYERETDESKK